jgi:hypothetical protein
VTSYDYELEWERDGDACYRFTGPGLPKYANHVMISGDTAEGRESYASRIAMFLRAAFEAGRQDKAREIREVLGMKP